MGVMDIEDKEQALVNDSCKLEETKSNDSCKLEETKSNDLCKSEETKSNDLCKSEETKSSDTGDSETETKFMTPKLSGGNGRKYCSVTEAISKSNKSQMKVAEIQREISSAVSSSPNEDDERDLQKLMADLKVSEAAACKIILPQTSNRLVSSVVNAQNKLSDESESDSDSDEYQIPIERGRVSHKLSIPSRVGPYSRSSTPNSCISDLSSSPKNASDTLSNTSDILTIRCVSQIGGNGGTMHVLSAGSSAPSLPQSHCNIHLNGSQVLMAKPSTANCQDYMYNVNKPNINQPAQMPPNSNRVHTNLPNFTLKFVNGSGYIAEAQSPPRSYAPRPEELSPFSASSISSPSSNDTYSSPSSVQSNESSSDNSVSHFNLEFKNGLVLDQDSSAVDTDEYNNRFRRRSSSLYGEASSQSSDDDINYINPTIPLDPTLPDPEHLELYTIDPNDRFDNIISYDDLDDFLNLQNTNQNVAIPQPIANAGFNNCQINNPSRNVKSSQFIPIVQSPGLPSRSRTSSGNLTSSEEKERNFQRIIKKFREIAPRPDLTSGIPSTALTVADILPNDLPRNESTSARQRLINELNSQVLNHARDFVNAKTDFAYFLNGDDQGDTPLHLVINDDSAYIFAVVEHFAKNNVIVDVPNDLGQTPLFCAVARNKPLLVEYLIEQGANPCHLCIDETTPMHVVAKHGDSHLEVAQVLCKSCQPNQLDTKNRDGYTPIVFAINNCRGSHIRLVEMLLQYGARIDGETASGTDGKSALHLAVQMGSLELVKVICRSCKTIARAINHLNFRDDSALHLAAQLTDENVQMGIINVLIVNGAKSNKNKSGKEPKDLVCVRRIQLKRILQRVEKLQ